jgi:hypothetical protein
MTDYQADLKNMVLDTSSKLLAVGSDAYLAQMDAKTQSVDV